MTLASDTNTSYPFCLANKAVPIPLSPAPNMTSFFDKFYRVLRVKIEATTSKMVMIQKRTAILLS